MQDILVTTLCIKKMQTDYREDTKTNKKSSERCNWHREALCRESPLKGKKGGSLLVNQWGPEIANETTEKQDSRDLHTIIRL